MIVGTKEFLLEKIEWFSSQADSYKFTYWLDEIFHDHFVEIEPSAFHDDEKFLDMELDISDEFYQRYPNESLTFLNNEQRNLMSDLEMVKVFSPKSISWFDQLFQLDKTERCARVVESYDYSLAA